MTLFNRQPSSTGEPFTVSVVRGIRYTLKRGRSSILDNTRLLHSGRSTDTRQATTWRGHGAGRKGTHGKQDQGDAAGGQERDAGEAPRIAR
jgi:hypothetical protein